MITLREAAQQALETLEYFRDTAICSADADTANETIPVLRAALENKSQKTHSEECWRWHHECAIAKIDRLEEIIKIATKVGIYNAD